MVGSHPKSNCSVWVVVLESGLFKELRFAWKMSPSGFDQLGNKDKRGIYPSVLITWSTWTKISFLNLVGELSSSYPFTVDESDAICTRISFLSYTEITNFEHTSLVLIVGIWKTFSYERGLEIRSTLNCSYQYWVEDWFLGGMKQIYAWYWNWYKADIYHNTLAASTQIKLLYRNAKSFKKCFSQRANFCEGKYRKSFDIFGWECAISQNEIFKIE